MLAVLLTLCLCCDASRSPHGPLLWVGVTLLGRSGKKPWGGHGCVSWGAGKGGEGSQGRVALAKPAAGLLVLGDNWEHPPAGELGLVMAAPAELGGCSMHQPCRGGRT